MLYGTSHNPVELERKALWKIEAIEITRCLSAQRDKTMQNR